MPTKYPQYRKKYPREKVIYRFADRFYDLYTYIKKCIIKKKILPKRKHKYFSFPVRIEHKKYDDFYNSLSNKINHKTFGNIKINELWYRCCDYRRNMLNDEWFVKFDFWCTKEDASDFYDSKAYEIIMDTVMEFAY